jgi:hypothetical protein
VCNFITHVEQSTPLGCHVNAARSQLTTHGSIPLPCRPGGFLAPRRKDRLRCNLLSLEAASVTPLAPVGQLQRSTRRSSGAFLAELAGPTAGPLRNLPANGRGRWPRADTECIRASAIGGDRERRLPGKARAGGSARRRPKTDRSSWNEARREAGGRRRELGRALCSRSSSRGHLQCGLGRLQH